MFSYLIRRLFTSILVLFGISMLVFSVIHLVPGDVTMAILGRQKVTEEKVAELREQLGLNDPLYVQYGRYLSKALRGDLGVSIRNNLSVSKAISDQLPSTFALAIAALSVALVIGGILGMLAALRHGSWVDTFVMGLIGQWTFNPNFLDGSPPHPFLLCEVETVPKHFQRLFLRRFISASPDIRPTRSSRRRAHGSRQHVGCAQQGLHHHRPRQGIARTHGHSQTCFAKCIDPRGYIRRLANGLSAWRRDHR